MAGNSAEFHESEDHLRPQTIEHHRAIVSLMEELEAVDWYDQRIDATEDPELRAILTHNRDEEKEHAAMALEWLRRRDPELDRFLRTYLFTEGPITEIEEVRELHQPPGVAGGNGSTAPTGNGASLGIGSLRGRINR
jgi:ferritin-like protein